MIWALPLVALVLVSAWAIREAFRIDRDATAAQARAECPLCSLAAAWGETPDDHH